MVIVRAAIVTGAMLITVHLTENSSDMLLSADVTCRVVLVIPLSSTH